MFITSTLGIRSSDAEKVAKGISALRDQLSVSKLVIFNVAIVAMMAIMVWAQCSDMAFIQFEISRRKKTEYYDDVFLSLSDPIDSLSSSCTFRLRFPTLFLSLSL